MPTLRMPSKPDSGSMTLPFSRTISYSAGAAEGSAGSTQPSASKTHHRNAPRLHVFERCNETEGNMLDLKKDFCEIWSPRIGLSSNCRCLICFASGIRRGRTLDEKHFISKASLGFLLPDVDSFRVASDGFFSIPTDHQFTTRR